MTGRPRFPVEAAAEHPGSARRWWRPLHCPVPRACSVRRAGRRGKQWRRWNEDPERSEWWDAARGVFVHF
jgi:hypothetical protein